MVFVLDKSGKPLMPCSEKRARLMLERGRAVVHKMYPFTVRLKDKTQEDCELQPVRLKIDPGSKVTGIALTRDNERDENVLFLAELQHRGQMIRDALESRRAMRKNRRNRKTRYRQARFLNRTKPKGWLAPSLQHRVDSTVSWVDKLSKLVPVSNISQELVRFDFQKMENPDISGIEYQQGTLEGYEVREYLLEKFNRKCTYCAKQDIKLQIEHVKPKSKGGSNKISNLCLACENCNQKKGNKTIEEFLSNKPELLKKILKQLKLPLKDAAAVNATRWKLCNELKKRFNVELSSGGNTKHNRSRFNIPKSHALDAACVGKIKSIKGWKKPTLMIKCTGRGKYKRTLLNKYGFPRGYLMKTKSVYGFQTGDIVKAVVLKGKNIGTYIGRIVVRKTGYFDVKTDTCMIGGVSYKKCSVIQRNDGYSYVFIRGVVT